MRPRLITIPLSHYAERARWALDAAGVDYDEEPHLQRFAGIRTKAVGGRHTVPVLLVGGEVLKDSADIVRWASAQAEGDPLYAGAERAEIEALEDELAGDYGVETRRITYEWFFRQLPVLMTYNDGASPWRERIALRMMRPLVVPAMKKYLRIDDEHLARGREIVRRTMDQVAERLADGRPYLLGDQFTAADLTFAAMTSISVAPREYGAAIPELDQLDQGTRAWIDEMRAHPAGAFALRLYRERPPVRARLPRRARIPRSAVVADTRA